jgi:hypothetical protein
LVEEVLIARVKGAEEEHDLENLRDGHRRAREGRKMPLEAGTKLVDPLFVTLPVIEERQQGGESVGNGRGAEVVLEDLEHLETLVVERRPRVLKEKPGGAVLQGRTELTLPKLAGKRIHRIRDKGTIRTGGGKSRAAEPIHDQIPRSEIIIRRLDRRESEAVDGKRNRVRRRRRQRREGGNRGSPGRRRSDVN